MSHARTTRRVLAAAATIGALLVTAACSSSGTPGASSPAAGGSGANWEERGPIVYAQGKDTSGNLKGEIDEWNAAHPNEQVSFIELPESADEQRAQMIQRGQAKSGEYTVMSVDVVWTAEFAANGWLEEMPADLFPTTGYLAAAVDSATYFDKLYAMPSTSDGAFLYYRKDLLDKAGVSAPPTTWADMEAACEKVLALDEGKDMSCYAGQHQKYEGLTCNIAEAVNGAGGEFITADGKAAVNTPEAIAGLQWMVDGFKSGMIPKEAITYKEEESRTAFQTGKLVFLRNWPYVYNLASEDDAIKDKFATAPLPGKDGVGVSTLGGHSFGISKFAKNKGTAKDFILWMQSKENQQRRLEKSSLAPVLEELYDDPALQEEFPYLKTLGDAIRNAKPRPKAVKYGDVTLAIQDATYAALQAATGSGNVTPEQAFTDLQGKLDSLLG